MKPYINWTLICTYVLLCVFCTVDSSEGVSCSTDGISIRGGRYSLSNSTNVGSELLYHCPDGYYPARYRGHTCLNSNGWFPRPSSHGNDCKIMTCPDPSLKNGKVSPSAARYEVGDQTTYACDDGYTFRGSATRTCQKNGKWNGVTPICDSGSGYCRDPGIPPGALRHGNQFDIGDMVTYRCSRLQLLGSKERTCLENGRWSGTEPSCNSKHSYDTIEEVSGYFSASLDNRLTLSGLDYDDYGKQVPRSVQMTQGGNLHIYIALDTSGSIGKDNFTVAKKCVKALIDKISYFQITPKYGILGFASKVNEIVNILSDSSHGGDQSILEEVEKLDYSNTTFGTGSNLAGAFKLIHERMSVFNTRKKLSGTHQAIFMFTDGKVNVGGSGAGAVAMIRNLMEDVNGKDWREYLDIYVFGIGEVNDEEINKLVSQKSGERHSYKLRDEAELTSLFNKIIDEGNSIGLCGLSWDFGDAVTLKSSTRMRYPWLTTVTVTKPDHKDNCLGSLVTPQFVLTAAHCFGNTKNGDNLSVKGISVEIYDQVRELAQGPIIHPDYDISKKMGTVDEFYDYDVALLKLKTAVDISIHVRPICIPCTKSSIRAAGLSTSTTCKAQEEFLLNLDLVPARFMSKSMRDTNNKDVIIKLNDMRETCRKSAENAKGVTDYREAVTENFLCTGGQEGGSVEKVSCKGDSGGALYLTKPKRHIQVGVVSWGVVDLCTPGSRTPDSTSISRDYHINLFRIQEFLKKNLGDDDSDYAALKFVN